MRPFEYVRADDVAAAVALVSADSRCGFRCHRIPIEEAAGNDS
jgi:hypothetical protein